MKRVKRFLKNNQWVILILVDAIALGLFLRMLFECVLDMAEFYAFMKIYAG